MNKNILSKAIATLLVLTMTFANIALLATESYALNANLEAQGTSTNNENVQFDAYFKDEKGEKIHTLVTDINEQTMLYMYVSVTEGYLKETTITIDNPNFILVADGVSYDEIDKIDTSSNTITLNKIRAGENVELAIPVKSTKSEEISVDMFSKETGITINGLLVKNNSRTTKISKTIKVNKKWQGNAEANLEQGVIKYIPYVFGEKSGIVLQTKIKTNLVNSNLPIEKTKIETVIPTINGISPENIYVNSDSTQSTNGKDGSNFNNTNWSKKENVINIEVANTVNNNKITWKKDCIDEYVLTFIYGEEAYKTLEETPAKISLNTVAEITAYNLETTKVSKENVIEGTLEENVNETVMFNIEADVSINKGYMYTKVDETKYNENITIDIANEELVDKITVTENLNKYISETEEYLANIQYKTTKINKDNFKTMLGEDGYIKIYNENNQQIAEINKNSEIDGNDYTVSYDTNVKSIIIETSKPQTVGKIRIQNIKAITTDENYALEQVKTFTILKTTINGEVILNEEKTITQEKEAISILEEPTTQIETIISNDTLSTIVENENVEIRTILKSSDITCKLFKNPFIKIQLPEYVENVSFNEAVKILFTDELEIETGTYNPETKTLEIQLKGEQTKYNDVSVAQGPTLVLNTNIKLNELTPSTTNEIITTVSNEEEIIETKTQINYQAPIGMVTVNKISGYNEEEVASSVSGQESTGKIETNSNAKEAVVTLTLINNNNNVCKNIEILGRTPFEGNKAITTGEDLGSTFTTELISKIIAVEGIDNNNITIYYSSNENATKDLTDTTNGWTLEPTNLAEVKSYLIILNDYEMATGTLVAFEYNTKIPEGLRNDEKALGTFVVYYDNVIESVEETISQPEDEEITNENNTTENTIIENNTTDNTIEENTTTENTIEHNTTTDNNEIVDKNIGETINHPEDEEILEPQQPTYEVLIPSQTQAPTVGVATEELPDVKVTLETDLKDNNFVMEGQVINYTATIVNMGQDTLSNLILSIPVPTGTKYREYVQGTSYSSDEIIETNATEKEILISELKPNQTKKLEMQVIVKEMKEQESIQSKAILSIDGYNNIESEIITSNIIKGILNIDMFTYLDRDKLYKEGNDVQYIAHLCNIKENTDARNITVTCVIPEELEYISAEYSEQYDNDYNKVSYDENTKTITWKISKLAAKERKKLILNCKVKENVTEFTTHMNATCSQSTETSYSNKVTRYVEKVALEVTHSSDITNEYVNVGDKITYYINVKNTGTAKAENINILDTLPTNIKDVLLSYKTNTIEKENIQSKNSTVSLNGISLNPEETLEIKINVTVDELSNDAKGTIKLINKVTVKAEDISEITPNEITHKLKVKEQPKEDEEKKIEISGIAWLDSSRDGKRDDNEELLKNIEVTLITKEDAKVVKTVKTNKKGEYTFEDVEKGEYLVVFEFDTTKYQITKYQAEGINEGKNSDAALQQVTFLNNGKTIEGAVTDTLKVEDANLYNIDLGLQESMKFDLSLTKTISKVTKQNNEGIKTYDYKGKNKTLAKVEIPSKEVNNTTIIIEYTLTVKNEGNVAGYVKQIVDKLPSDLKFVAESNKDWYKSTDGNLYNKSLADTIINPGETKEIKLVVTKATTEKTLGTTNNTAEIYESYNDYGVEDIDSVSGNNKTKEDDYGSADILITLNTGTIIIYTGLILSMIATIGVGAYIIKKKVIGEM